MEEAVTLIAAFTFVGVFGMLIGMNVGIRLERFRRDKEVEAYQIPPDRESDVDYWRRMYEDLANDYDKRSAQLRRMGWGDAPFVKREDEREQTPAQ